MSIVDSCKPTPMHRTKLSSVHGFDVTPGVLTSFLHGWQPLPGCAIVDAGPWFHLDVVSPTHLAHLTLRACQLRSVVTYQGLWYAHRLDERGKSSAGLTLAHVRVEPIIPFTIGNGLKSLEPSHRLDVGESGVCVKLATECREPKVLRPLPELPLSRCIDVS